MIKVFYQTIMYFNCLICFLIFSISLFSSEYYPKFVQPIYSIGDTFVYSVTTEKDGASAQITQTKKVKDTFSSFGELVTEWEVSTSDSNYKKNEQHDANGIFFSTGGSSPAIQLTKTFTTDLGEYFLKYNIIESKVFYFAGSEKINGQAFYCNGNGTIRSIFNGIETVETSFGPVECYKLIRQIRTTIILGNTDVGVFVKEEFQYGTVWFSEVHGTVKSEITSEIKLNNTTTTLVEDKFKNISILTYSPYYNKTQSIVSYNADEILKNKWKGWAWMGSLPWIYNANTGHWGYLANEELYVWDASESQWLFFNRSNQSWDYAQR